MNQLQAVRAVTHHRYSSILIISGRFMVLCWEPDIWKKKGSISVVKANGFVKWNQQVKILHSSNTAQLLSEFMEYTTGPSALLFQGEEFGKRMKTKHRYHYDF